MKKYYLLASLCLSTAFLLTSCGGGGGSSIAQNEPFNPQPSEPGIQKPSPGGGEVITTGNVLYSVNGTAMLVFKDGVIISKTNTLEPQANNIGNKTILVPHTGATSIQLKINDADSDTVYVLGEIDNSSITQHPLFGINSGGQIENISGYDSLLQQDLSNYKAIKVTVANGQATLDWKFQDNTGGSEGDSFTIQKMRVANLLSQGNQNYIDVGDYFNNYTIQFNALPSPDIVPTSNCPINLVGGDGPITYEIPPTKDCISLKFSNPDSAGFNPQYSLDNGNTFNNINDFTQIYDSGNLGIQEGSSKNVSVIVKEFLDQDNTISDQKTFTFSVYKDENKVGNTSLTATCTDTTTNNSWTANDNGICEFADPGNNQYAGTITVSGSSALNGNCRVVVIKDGDNNNPVDNKQMSCSSINISYNVPASEKGTGNHTLVVKVRKKYIIGDDSSTEIQIDQFTITYKVNQAPTITP